jgi:hypothetical protein
MPSHSTKRSWTSEVVCSRLPAASRFRVAFADIDGSNQAAQSGRSRMAICRSCRHEDDEALTKIPPSAARRKPHGNDLGRSRVTALQLALLSFLFPSQLVTIVRGKSHGPTRTRRYGCPSSSPSLLLPANLLIFGTNRNAPWRNSGSARTSGDTN